MNIKIDHINLTVRNLEESINWYKTMFGFELKEGELKDSSELWAIVGKDDSMICMYEENLKSPEMKDSAFHKIYHFGIRVSDKDDWEKRLQENNIKLLYGGVHKYPRSLSWYFFDPSGHKIEVSYAGNEPLRFA